MTLPTVEKLIDLKESNRLSSQKDFDFAESLLSYAYKHGDLTEKQEVYAVKLIDRIENPRPIRRIPSVEGVVDLLNKVTGYPKLWLRFSDGVDLRIHKAGERSKYNGQLQLTDGLPFGDNQYFGRIDVNGEVHLSGKGNEREKELLKLLTSLANDPEGVASEYGKLTGNCSFCHRPLSDDRSIAVGYGSTCAKNYGLGWGLSK